MYNYLKSVSSSVGKAKCRVLQNGKGKSKLPKGVMEVFPEMVFILEHEWAAMG